jgi:LuxR family transcriptional regulator, maltose regulon positive regulatory protein
MSIRNLIILSQLNPPAQRSRVLSRIRVNEKLQQSINYPLTILEAGTGYGKSTSILSFINSQGNPVYWFTISGTERDPILFLAKLFTAFNQHNHPIGDEPLKILDIPDAKFDEALIAFVNAVTIHITQDAFLILDDFHLVCDVADVIRFMDWIIEHLPTKLHIIIATRHTLNFPSLNKWRVKGEVLKITRDDLAFTSEEVAQLFERQYGITLSEPSIDQLLNKTEGWAISLQMIWQTLQNNPDLTIQQVLEDERQSKSTLFNYLAEEVLGGLSTNIQNFLVKTSILSKLENTACDFLLTIDNSDVVLTHLNDSGLFVEELRPGVYRYHQMFRAFLLNQIQQNPAQVTDLHLKIASYFRAHEYWEEAIYHLLSAKDFFQVNQILESIGTQFILDGRHESINYWIHEIPESHWKNYPYLIYLLGEVNRYLGSFEDALEFYHQAERLYRALQNPLGISRALRGQGQVFLDTIRPNNADQLLQDALRLLDPSELRQEVADLLVLIAENQLNLGFPENAEKLLSQASELMPDLELETDFIQARVFLRTGRLNAGVDLLLAREANNPSLPLSRPQRFHRESTLLLSLYYSILGEHENAEKYAQQGIEIGKLLRSKFVQAVGFMRLGHALLLRDLHPFNNNGFDQAMQYFRGSIEQIDVVRIHVEPLWGMCRALGYDGQYKKAEELALESLAIAEKAGDEWISILIHLSLGAGAVFIDDQEAAQRFLTTAETSAIRVKDPFALCAARMWLALKAWKQGYQNTAFSYFEKCLSLVKKHGYDFLLTRETLLGLKDRESIYPLALAAYWNGIEIDFLSQILGLRGIANDRYHPGYTLWVQTLGNFRVWRGDRLVDTQDWKREKARLFFQILVAQRGKWVHKDLLNEWLWPESLGDNSASYLKVIFNAANQVLEPERPRGEDPFFIERHQESYRLNPKARLIVDADLFVQKINQASPAGLENALNLYQGRYFNGSPVNEWLTVEEQYYHQQFMLAADRLLNHYIEMDDYPQGLDITYQILNEDPFSEAAYRAQMLIFHKLGQHSMVHEVYHRCTEMLSGQLNAPISRETEDIYQQLISE